MNRLVLPVPSRGGGWFYLVFAAVFLALANGRWHLSLAAWLAPLFLLLFLLSRAAGSGLVTAFVIQLGAFFVNWWGMIPVPGVFYYLVAGP